MGWQDAPIVEDEQAPVARPRTKQPAWMSAPIVDDEAAPGVIPQTPGTRATAGDYTQRFEQPEGPGVLSRIGTAIKETVAPTNVEDLPEFGGLIGGPNLNVAATPEGQVNLLRQHGYPGASLTTDKFGNPAVTLGQPQKDVVWDDGFKRVDVPADQKYYLNKPGASLADVDYMKELLTRAAIPVAASAALAPAGILTGMAGVGTSGVASEGFKQTEAAAEGAGEGADVWRMAKEGFFSSLGEGGGRAISWGLGNVLRRLSGRPQAPISQFIDDSGNMTAEGTAILRQEGITLDELAPEVQSHLLALQRSGLTPQAARRLEDFQAIGIQPTRAQVTREFPAFQFEKETEKLADVGAPLRQRASETGARIRSELERLTRETGGVDNPVRAGQELQRAVRQKFDETGQQVSALYEQAREQAGRATFIPKGAADEFHSNVSDVIDDFEDVIPAPVRRRLTEFSSGDRAFTLDEAEKLRKLINMRYEAGDNATRAGLNRIRGHLDDAIDALSETGGEAAGLFQQARAAASERFREFGVNRTTKSNKVIAALVDDAIPEEQIFNKAILNSSARDLRNARFLLTHGTREQVTRGTAAMNDMRGATMQWIANNARSGTATDELGQPIFSGSNFKKALEKIGDEKLRVIFTEPEITALRRLDRIGEALAAPPGSVNYSGTSAAIMNIMNRLKNIPMAGGVINMLITVRKQMQTGAALDPVQRMAREASRATRVTPRAGTATGVAYGDTD